MLNQAPEKGRMWDHTVGFMAHGNPTRGYDRVTPHTSLGKHTCASVLQPHSSLCVPFSAAQAIHVAVHTTLLPTAMTYAHVPMFVQIPCMYIYDLVYDPVYVHIPTVKHTFSPVYVHTPVTVCISSLRCMHGPFLQHVTFMFWVCVIICTLACL